MMISKRKSDVFELLLMPFLLIAILGLSLSGIMSGETVSIDPFPVGIVEEQNIQEDLEMLDDELAIQGVPQQSRQEILGAAEEIDPSETLMELLQSEDMEDLIIVEEFETQEDAEEAVRNEEITSIITVPENFSFDMWQSLLLGEETQASLNLVSRGSDFSSSILESITASFVDQYNLEASIAFSLDEGTMGNMEGNVREQGDNINLSGEEPISAFQYYTIGMGVMFALSTAPVIAGFAFKEKQDHVLSRIMLAGKKPLVFLVSKLISATLIVFVQLLILFVLSDLFFGTLEGRGLSAWLNLIYTTGIYSLVVGSITSLLISMSLYANDISTVSFFELFITIFAFVGGSFFPVEQISEGLQAVGNWTPNGAAMTSYLQLLQGFEFQEVLPLMTRLVFIGTICLIIAVLIFPKRRLD